MSKYNYNRFARAEDKAQDLRLWDMLSIVVLFLTLCIGVYFVAIFLFPNQL